MNIILSGLDGCGKTTLAEKLRDKYGMKIIHSTAETKNDLDYHLNLLDYQENVVFDRFHTGERIYPFIKTDRYKGRVPKLSQEDFDKITKRIIENNDMYIIFVTTDLSIIEKRLIERGEYDYLDEVKQQQKLYLDLAYYVRDKFNYKNFYICDIAEEGCYDKLDKWIDEHYGKKTLNVAYRKLAQDLLDYGKPIDSENPRGATKELCNYCFTIDDVDTNECVTLKTGATNLGYVAAEMLWYWSGRNDVDFIGKFAKLWTKLSDDGKTNNSAYGYILKKKHGFDQIEKIIELLKHDKNTRRAILNINIPNEHVIETKDEMCTICLGYQIRDNKLHCTCVMRSNDFNFGLRNDALFFLFLLNYIADRVGVGYGSYTHFAMSMHMYDRDIKFAKQVAYGTMETMNERLDVKKLLEHQEELINWVDNDFTCRKDFEQKLKDLNIIYEAMD